MKNLDRNPAVLRGPAKTGKRTKILVTRLAPGDLAVIDHQDLDELGAKSLVQAKVAAVINAADSLTGRYPNQGPQVLWRAGIPHFDRAGSGLLGAISDGEILTLREGALWRGREVLARLRPIDQTIIRRQGAVAAANLDSLLDDFVQNTLDYARREKKMLLQGLTLPTLQTSFAGKHTLVVVRGRSYREDLQAISHYIAEVKPVLLAVDGGADLLLEYGYRPDLIIGDMDSVSDHALIKARERVVHAYPAGGAPGLGRIKALGLPAAVVRAPGTSEDLALLLAYELGAKLIAAIGTHTNMIDFLEKGRPGMASTFLVRLKIGDRLVDARGVSQLYRSRVPGHSLFLLALAAALPALALIAGNPTVRHLFRLFFLRLRLAF